MSVQSDCCFFKTIIIKKDLLNLLQYRAIAEQIQIIPAQNIKAIQESPNCQVDGEKLFKSINSHPSSEITTTVVWKCILSEFKNQILFCYLLKQMESLLRVALSFFISKIFDSLEGNDKRFCFIYAGITGLIWILMAILDQNAWRQIEQISLKIKSSLTYSLYRKILYLSNFNLSGNQSGEIVNSITEFHDILQTETIYIFTCLSAPLSLVGLTALLVYQIGWVAIAGVSLSVLFEFIHYHYANYNSHFYGEICQFKDQRVQNLTDVISAFRYIKMQIWERFFIRKISRIREEEMKGFIRYGAGRSLEIALSEGISTASMLLIISTTAQMNDSLTSKTIIESILTILLIKLIIIYSSYGISCYYQINSLMDRVASVFAKMPIRPTESLQEDDGQTKQIIVLKDVWCSYSEDIQQNYVLKQVNLSIQAGQFIGVFGQVGEGKSTFLIALSKQMPYIRGQLKIRQAVSFQQSQPSLFTGTIEDNILFGKAMNKQPYEKSIQYSCLDSDLASMPLGDQSIIEQGAVNLSGGQRTRLCLARVIYSDSPIILLDDPLSSLDSRVIEKIMHNLIALNKEQGKTIVLATHQTHCLVKCDRCIQIDNKRIRIVDQQQFIMMKEKYIDFKAEDQIFTERNQIQLSKSNIRSSLGLSKQKSNLALEKILSRIHSAKEQEIIISKRGFIVTFLSFAFQNKWNYLVFPSMLLFYTVSQTIYGILIFLLNEFDQVQAGTHSVFKEQKMYWLALGLMSGSIFICHIIRTFLLNLTIQLANSALHEKALNHLFRANILELDNLGTKGILDKFSTDLGLLDVGLLQDLSSFFITSFISIVQMIIIAIVNPIILPFAFGMMIPLYIWYSYCSKVISILKQLDLNEKGPVIGLFSQTLSGLMQIKNMKAEQYMTEKLKEVLNNSILQGVNFRKVLRVYTSLNTYYTTLAIIGGYFALIATNDSSNFGNFTFAAVFLVQINECAVWIATLSTKINSTLVSVERILSLTQLRPQTERLKQTIKSNVSESNARLQIDNIREKKDEDYVIGLRNLCLRYGQQKSLALRNISVDIRKGQKIALIGRTGSGKSSIIQALYRLIEPEPSSVYIIDGEDASNMEMELLRSKFTCIPQVAFTFADNLRNNLDPHGKFTDVDIIMALKKVQIYDYVQSFEEGLNVSLVAEEFALSAGQKQLICLARAILQKKSFLILDEATSNIDHQTDSIIQELIRKEFIGKTIIVVAHRLQTILDFDQILVLAKGQIVEKGTAKELYERNGQFFGMINDSGKQKYELIKTIEQQK